MTRSYATALISVLIFSFHPALAELFYNDGTIYDVLCLSFSIGALTLYVRRRRDGQLISSRDIAIFSGLLCLALGSKEMALTLPAILAFYEIIFRPNRTDLPRRLMPILVSLAIVTVCMTVKVFVPNQMSINELYSPWRPAAQVFGNYLHYHQLLFLAPQLSGVWLSVILLGAAAVAITLRERLLFFGFSFTLLALLPVCVIPGRAGFVWYLPLVGYALYLGRSAALLSAYFSQPVQAVLFAALIAILLIVELPSAAKLENGFLAEENQLRNLVSALRAYAPVLPQNSRVLLVRDQFFSDYSWLPLFALRLAYGDSTLWVDRAVQMGNHYNPADTAVYAAIFDWDGSKYEAKPVVPLNSAPVTVTINPSVIHRGHNAAILLDNAPKDCPIDAEYRMPDDELQRSGLWLNWSAGSKILVDADAERGRVQIQAVRACHGRWQPALGSFLIIP